MKLCYGRFKKKQTKKNLPNKNVLSKTFSLESDAVRDHDKYLLHQHPFLTHIATFDTCLAVARGHHKADGISSVPQVTHLTLLH